MRPEQKSSTWSRIAWFVGLWGASVAALAVVALVIRWALRA
jgi:hypothetical protein